MIAAARFPFLRATLLLLLGLLAACGSRAPLPQVTAQLALPLQLHVLAEQAGETHDWLLVIQAEGEALRWSLFDPLGVPLARQRLLDGDWRNDGLLPPNPAARELFAGLLFALTPAAQLAQAYPGARLAGERRSLWQGGAVRWQVEPIEGGHALQIADARYRITPLATEVSP